MSQYITKIKLKKDHVWMHSLILTLYGILSSNTLNFKQKNLTFTKLKLNYWPLNKSMLIKIFVTHSFTKPTIFFMIDLPIIHYLFDLRPIKVWRGKLTYQKTRLSAKVWEEESLLTKRRRKLSHHTQLHNFGLSL